MTDQISTGFYESTSSRKKSLPSKLSPSSIEKKKVQCHECGFSCSSYAQLKVHNRIHTGDKPFECPDCNYASTRNANLQRHIASMHAGRYSAYPSPAIGKRGRPPNSFSNANKTDPLSPVGGIFSHIQNFSSLPGKPIADQHFMDSLSTSSHREHVKSPLSEIRARELMLAENTVCHDKGIADELTQSVIEGSVRPRLLHPASQVLALPAHIPLVQESSSSFSSNSIADEPIVIEDDVSGDGTGMKHPLGTEELQAELQQPQVPLDKPMLLPDDKILADTQPSPVLITPNVNRATSSSPEVIPIEDQPSMSLEHKQGLARYTCIVNDSLNTTPVSHSLVADETPGPAIPSVSSAVYQEIPSVTCATPAGLTTAKFNQRHPLVLEVENSSIGLYLHLDLSKYLCETACNWLSQHTRECTEVCRANFPDHTSSAAASAEDESMETDLRPTPSVIPSPPIPISNQVPTISKAPSIPPNHTRAFPTAILAAPQPLQSGNPTEAHSSKQLNFSMLNKSHLSSVNRSKLKRSEVNQDLPQGLPALLNASEHTNNGSVLHSSSERQKQSSIGAIQDSGPPQEHTSLIFQRWPALRQYMQVRCLAGNQKEFSCYKCGKQFPQLHQLKVHVKNHIKRYNCNQCHYSTHRMANLRRHQLTHRQLNELTCQLCRAVMANKRAYTMHVLFAHKKLRKKSKDFDSWRKQFSHSIAAKNFVLGGRKAPANMQATVSQPPDADDVTGETVEPEPASVLDHTVTPAAEAGLVQDEAKAAEADLVQDEATAVEAGLAQDEPTGVEAGLAQNEPTGVEAGLAQDEATTALSSQDSIKETEDQEEQSALLNNYDDHIMETEPSNNGYISTDDITIKEEAQESHPEEEWSKKSHMEERPDDTENMDSSGDRGEVIGDATIKQENPSISDHEDIVGSTNHSEDANEINREQPITDAVT